MTLEDAYRLFKLTPADGAVEAERVYGNLRSNIFRHMAAEAQDSPKLANMKQALEDFDTAIDIIRRGPAPASAGGIPENWLDAESSTPAAPAGDASGMPSFSATESELEPAYLDSPDLAPTGDLFPPAEEPEAEDEANLTQIMVPPRPIEELAAEAQREDAEGAQGYHEMAQEPSAPGEPASATAQASGANLRMAAIAGSVVILAVSVWAIVAIMSPDTDEPASSTHQAGTETPAPKSPTSIEPPVPPPVAPPAAESASEYVDNAGLVEDVANRYQRLLQLSQSTGPISGETGVQRMELVQLHIARRELLDQMEVAIDSSNPADSATLQGLLDEAEQQLSRVPSLDEALSWQSLVDGEVERLLRGGLRTWPPTGDEIDALMTEEDAFSMTQAAADDLEGRSAVQDGNFSSGSVLMQSAYARLSVIEINAATQPVAAANLGVQELYQRGLQAIDELKLTRPFNGSAMFYAQKIEEVDPSARQAAQIRKEIHDKYIHLAQRALDADELNKAERYANSAQKISSGSVSAANLLQEVNSRKLAKDESRFVQFTPVADVNGLRMVKVPAGSFRFGAPRSAFRTLGGLFKGLSGTQLKFHLEAEEAPPVDGEVSAAFAVSETEVTVEQFGNFVVATGYKTEAERRGSSTVYFGDREIQIEGRSWRQDYLGNPAPASQPVLYVSHNDAVRFTEWLSEISNARYRLPTEVEFEYITRAGSTELLPWTSKVPPDRAGNFRGAEDPIPETWKQVKGRMSVRSIRGYGDGHFGPALVGSFSPNRFALHDTLGNVGEWVSNCHSTSPVAAGAPPSPNNEVNCDYRLVRGTDWASDARVLRSTFREGRTPDFSSNRVGFRVVREIDEHAQ